MGFNRRLGLTLIELMLSASIFLILVSSILFVLLTPLKQTLQRLQMMGTEIRLAEGLRQMQDDLFFAYQVKVLGKKVQGIAPDGQIFTYEETPKGFKRTLGQSTQYFTLPEDQTSNLVFSLQSGGLLKIDYQDRTIFLKVNP